jgi:hypothetical protein
MRPLVASLGLNNLPRTVKAFLLKSRASKSEDSRCKMAGAGFYSFLLNSALKCLPRTVSIRDAISADCHRDPTADCHSQGV